MRISDWSSDVCSSDLSALRPRGRCVRVLPVRVGSLEESDLVMNVLADSTQCLVTSPEVDRKSVVSGKSVSVRVDLGGRRIVKKKTTHSSYALGTHKTYIQILHIVTSTRP